MEPLNIVSDDFLDDHAQQMAAHDEMQRHIERCEEFSNACRDLAVQLKQAQIYFQNVGLYEGALDEGKDSIERAGLELGTLIQAVKTYWRSGE
tara:strand:- start:1443 stop:1721 length:279 start_codon:yes stop_codon:yes gene_type:complete